MLILYVDRFSYHLAVERQLSPNTVASYGAEAASFQDFLDGASPAACTSDDVAAYLGARGIEHLEALYGLSYGGGMATRFLVSQKIPVDRAIIDAGTAPYAYPKWLCKLICVRDYWMLKMGRASVGAMKATFPPERFARDIRNADAEYLEIQKYLKSYTKH